MLYFTIALFVAIVSSTVFELNTTSEGFVIPYRVVGGGSNQLMTIPIVTVYDGYSVLQPSRHFVRNDWMLTTVDGDHYIVADLSTAGRRSIIATFNSSFATEFAQTYFMIPMHRQLVINPSNPEEFVYGGQMETFRSTSDQYLKVRVSVEVLNIRNDERRQTEVHPTTSPIYDFAIATGFDDIFVPEPVLMDLRDAIQRRGIYLATRWSSSRRSITLEMSGDMSEEIIDSLPTIQFRIHNDSGNDVMILLYGRDYIGPAALGDIGRRQLLVRSSSSTNGEGLFGRSFVSKVALFVDNVNRIIGIGEPL
jgi:hypothetical protein